MWYMVTCGVLLDDISASKGGKACGCEVGGRDCLIFEAQDFKSGYIFIFIFLNISFGLEELAIG